MDNLASSLIWQPALTLPDLLVQQWTAACMPLPPAVQAASGPGGASLRYAPTYHTIRAAREEDDPTLPRGDWDRPLKRADWPAVARLCVETLQLHSKDFQAAAWLSEAWTRQYGTLGICASIALVEHMLDEDWEHGFPSIADGDLDPRTGVIVWWRDTLVRCLTHRIALLPLRERQVSLEDWLRLVQSGQALRVTSDQDDEDVTLDRDALIASVDDTMLATLVMHRRACAAALHRLPGLVAKIDAVITDDAPSFERMALQLDALRRAANSLIDERAPDDEVAPLAPSSAFAPFPLVSDGIDMSSSTPIDDTSPLTVVHDSVTSVTPMTSIDADAPPSPVLPMNEAVGALPDPAHQLTIALGPTTRVVETPHGPLAIHDRQHAYAIMEALARYLSETEPHSPTAYLLMRGVSWGSMSLLELMHDISQDEGDLQRYFSAIGVRS
ncbi:type VI secretion system ImpA family N-terminal domain-containing protein [Robbsia sp. KACC 23696]|uniref:type VI secretion system ImpA family N-terminal domain-containing protein n=1 Tax=Robbsia sp. KACC 23696 TaxID=3149231 RepID=UPI00325A8B61